MALTVQTNTAAMTALKNLNTNSNNMNASLGKLSSGFRVQTAADDASGFAVSSKLDAQTSRLKAASLNATQAQAMTKMADAGVNEIQNMVVRIQTLALQGASANNAGELGKLDAERLKLESAIDKIANSTNYNGVNLLNGKDAASLAVVGTAATVGAVTQGGAATTNAQIAITGTATFTDAASFSIDYNAAGKVTSVTSNVALNDVNGTQLFAAGVNILSAANQATPIAAPTAVGLTFTATAATGTGVAGTATTAAATGGVAGNAAGGASYTAALAFQVGADNNADNQVGVDLRNAYTTTALGLGGAGTLTTQAGAQAYINTAKAALDTLVIQRADLGATQNQVAFIQANIATGIEQGTASVSSIRDADMAAEMADFTKNKILTQAGTSMLAQANQAAQNVLSLFR